MEMLISSDHNFTMCLGIMELCYCFSSQDSVALDPGLQVVRCKLNFDKPYQVTSLSLKYIRIGFYVWIICQFRISLFFLSSRGVLLEELFITFIGRIPLHHKRY